MGKKRKHKYVITETNYNGELNPNMASEWNAECLADYFFMEYYIKDEIELEENPNDEYYRGNTSIEVIPHKQRYAFIKNKKLYWKWKHYEEIVVYKRSVSARGVIQWFEVYRTTNMEDICELFQEYNEHYYTYGWNSTYEQYIDSFQREIDIYED